jgi:outer membrane protein
MSFRTYGIKIAALLLASAFSVVAQTNPPAAGPGKVGFADIRAVIGSTAEGKQAAAELQSQFSPRQSELENLQKSIEDLQNRLNAGQRTMSDEERARLQRQGERLASQLKRKQEEFQEDANAAQQDMVDRVGRKVVEVVNRFARENGFTLILDAQTACGIYCQPQLDVTQDIIRLYDQANPVKAGAAAPATPRPAAARPAPQPATPAPTKKPPR